MPTSRFRKVFVLNTDCLATTIQVSDDLKCFYSKRFQFSFFLHFLSFLVWMKSSTCFLFTQKAKRHKLNMIQDSKGRHALKKRRKAMRGRETDFWKQTCPWYRFIQSPYLMKDISIDPLHNLGCFLYVQLLLCTHRMRSILTWNI